MRIRFRIALLAIFTVLASISLRGAFALLNMPSDAAFYGGVVLLLVGFTVLPTIAIYLFKRIK